MADVTFWRLTEAFIQGDGSQFFFHGGRKDFIEWEEIQPSDPQHPRRKVAARYFGKLKNGEPVADDVIHVFSEYLFARKSRQWRMSEIAEVVDTDAERAGTALPRFGIAGATWSQQLTTMFSPEILRPPARCRTKARFLDAAQIVMRCIARHDGTELIGRGALQYGEKVMQRTTEEYAGWLELLCRTNENAVLFALHEVKRRPIRVGVSVAVAITDNAYERLRSGKSDETEIGKSDLVPRGRSLFVDAVAENDEFDLRKGKSLRAVIATNAVFKQLALLCAPTDLADTHLRVITLARTRECIRVLRASAFQELAARTPRTGRAIFECAWPGSSPAGARRRAGVSGVLGAMPADINNRLAHLSMRCVIASHQKVIEIHKESR